MTVSKTFTKTESKSPLLVGAFIDEEVREEENFQV